MLDTLEHLIKGGRVGGARALLGQVLSIKPLLELKDGVVAEAGRQRTRSKALVAIAEVVKSHAPLKRLALVHGASSEVAALEALVADVADRERDHRHRHGTGRRHARRSGDHWLVLDRGVAAPRRR
jgi:fatty acid-binding protein DegV